MFEALTDTGAPGWLIHSVLKSYLWAEVKANIPGKQVEGSSELNTGIHLGLAESGYLYAVVKDHGLTELIKMWRMRGYVV